MPSVQVIVARFLSRQASLDVAKRFAPGELREGHDAKQLGAASLRTPASPLCRSTMRPKVFQGTNSMTCANSVLPTFMHHPGLFKPVSIANRKPEIQIVDTHENLETRVNKGCAAC